MKKETKKAAAEPAPTQKSFEGRIWALTFADFSYVAQDPTLKGSNAFEFRRVYLGYDQDISDHFFAQVLLEADKYDTTASGYMGFFVKHAYLEWKDLVPSSSVFFGLSQTPSIALAEKYWGYRSLEKVILDRTGLVATSDMGVGIRGKIVSDGSLGYALMVGNGNGARLENNKLKRFYGELNFEPMRGGVVEAYADYENYDNHSQAQPRLTAKGLFGYLSPGYSFGLEGFYRNVQHGWINTSGFLADSNYVGGSVYGSFRIAENLRGVLRGDITDVNLADKDVGIRQVYGIVGLDYNAAKDVDIIPNVLYSHALNKKSGGPTLVDNITARLTASYAFSARIP